MPETLNEGSLSIQTREKDDADNARKMSYQFNEIQRKESARVLEELVFDTTDNRRAYVIRINPKDFLDVTLAIKTAIKELRRPNPCDNCYGVGLAISHGYTDMRIRPEE